MRRWLSGLAGIAGLVAPSLASAAEPSAGIDLYSAYVWRGITLQDAPVVQPWVDLSGIHLGRDVSLGLNVWTNFLARDVAQDRQLVARAGALSEIDTAVTLSLPKGFRVGVVEYTLLGPLAGDVADSGELFAGWTKSFGVNVSANAYYEFQVIEGFYGSIAIGRTVTVVPKLMATLEVQGGVASAGFARYYGGAKAGAFDYEVSGKLSFAASGRTALAVTVGYAGSLDRNVLPGQPASFHGGLTGSITF